MDCNTTDVAFNSLFEMLGATDWSVSYAVAFRLSILYLRCPLRHKRVQVAWRSCSFNSLFEMRRQAVGMRSQTKRTFNSLFEMRTAFCRMSLKSTESLSILYLRCIYSYRFRFGCVYVLLSILYLRCYPIPLPEGDFDPSTFNSLFEMRRAEGAFWRR